MTIPDTLARMIAEREEDMTALQAELDVLRGLKTPRVAPKANGRPRPETRQEMVAKLVRAAGRNGLTRREAIDKMASLCNSPPASVAQMLTNLRIANIISPHQDGRWRVIR